MNTFKIAVIFISVLVSALFLFIIGFSVSLDSKWEYSTSIEINESDSIIFNEVNTIKNWLVFSPWNTDNDPSARFRFEGEATGNGSKMIWENDRTSGVMEITKSVPFSVVLYEQSRDDSDMPFEGKLTFKALTKETTLVTWSTGSYTPNPIKRLAMHVYRKMILEDLNQGLQSLKTTMEEK